MSIAYRVLSRMSEDPIGWFDIDWLSDNFGVPKQQLLYLLRHQHDLGRVDRVSLKYRITMIGEHWLNQQKEKQNGSKRK